MAQKSGFFNAVLYNGAYDRTYSADDYCDNLATVIKNGVRYSKEDDLKVSAANKMALSVSAGYAWINGHYYHNTTAEEIVLDTAPTGDMNRIDRIVIRLDTSVETRSIVLAVVKGSAAGSPVAPALTREGNIYEICLADVFVGAGVTSITASNITDQRENGVVCGWASSVTPAIMSMLRRYSWRTVLTSATNTVDFDIAQYSDDDVHIINVYTNGLLDIPDVDYTVSGNTITFNGSRVVGTEIVVELYKSIDGTGLESVADKFEALEAAVAKMNTTDDFDYVCNGVNDNIVLSQLAQTWLDGGTDYASKIIRVYGTFGVSTPYGGSGTSSSPYRWMSLGGGSAKNRKIIFDFSACSTITISCASGTHNVVFFGMSVDIIGANVVANGGASITMFSTAGNTFINAEKCRFWITSVTGYIARGGTFRDCRVSVTASGGDAFGFPVLSSGLLRLFGGEYYAYAPTAYTSAIVHAAASQAGAVINTYSINCPAVLRSGYVQSYSIYVLTNDACCSFTDTITTLAISAAGQNIRGTIAQNKNGLM